MQADDARRLRRFALCKAASFVAVVVTLCYWLAPWGAAVPVGLSEHRFALGQTRLRILLPGRYELRPITEVEYTGILFGPASEVQAQDPARPLQNFHERSPVPESPAIAFVVPGMREMHFLTLRLHPGWRSSRGEDFPESIRLADGLLRYRVEYDEGGGSGGTCGTMSGEVELPEGLLEVSCGDQSEWWHQPAWCLPYLYHLRVERSP